MERYTSQPEARQEAYDYMRGLLPGIIPATDPISGNTFNSFLDSLAESQGHLLFNLDDFHQNINVLTATISGIGAWEDLVGLQRRTDLTLENRRARVYARMSGTPCTVQTIKDIVKGYTGNDGFEIFEYYTLGDSASAFKYKVIINRPPTNTYDEETLQLDLLRIQPAHCGTFVEIEDKWDNLLDELTLTESISATVIDYFTIGTSTIGGPDVIAP